MLRSRRLFLGGLISLGHGVSSSPCIPHPRIRQEGRSRHIHTISLQIMRCQRLIIKASDYEVEPREIEPWEKSRIGELREIDP